MMKSYFAKLADRVTHVNAPAPSAVYAPRMSDPFEDSSLQKAQPLLMEKSARSIFTPEPDLELSAPERDSKTERTGSMVETHQRTISEQPTETPTLKTKSLQESLVNDRITEVEPLASKSLIAPPVETDPELETAKVEQLTPRESPESRVFSSKEQTSNETVTKQSADERISEIEREQSVLLRKADAFMSRLLDIQRPAAENENKVTSETPRSEIRSVESQQVNRLEPAQRLPPPTPHESDGPSLIIGRLTIEVTPPSSPTPPPQPQRIIVRGSRGRESGMTSSRRFGLGQF
jgi:hypothetical protein